MGKIDKVIEDFHYSMAFFVTKGRQGLLFGSIYTIHFWFVECAMVPVIRMGLNQTFGMTNKVLTYAYIP